MRSIGKLAGFVIIVFLVTVACATKEPPLGLSTEPSTPQPMIPAQAEWQKDWEKTLSEARKEGKVILYGSFGPQVRTALIKEMKEAYGIDAEVIRGRGIELVTKIKSERRAGLFLADLLMAGETVMLTMLRPEVMLDPLEPKLILPEVVDSTKWDEGKLHWLDKEGKYIVIFAAGPSGNITINTNLVKPDEIRSYKNLLEPKWKGKIVIQNPVRSGPGNSWFTNMVEILGEDYMRALTKQEPIITSDERLQTDWIVRGKYPISIAIGFAQNFQQMAEAGAPVAMHKFIEGEYLTAGDSYIAILNRAAHPNAAKVFLNWLLTPGSQTMMSMENLRQSFRIDVPTDFLPPGHKREPGKKYTPLTEEKAFRKVNVLTPIAQEIFGPLIR